MFGNNKKKETGKASSVRPTPGAHSLNSLVVGTIIEGTIKSESDIRVDGTIKGSLYCKSKVIIGPSGSIEGEINCQNAVVEGKFDGNFVVAELLNIRETAKVFGDVKTSKLIVQSGAIFDVNCKMVSGSSSNAAPKPNKVTKPVAKPEIKQAAGVSK